MKPFSEASERNRGPILAVLAVFDLALPDAQSRLDEMCRKLLANGVIEDYRFELSE